MEYTTEREKLSVVFEVKENVTEDDIEGKGLKSLRKGLVEGDIKDESECFEYITNMQSIARPDDDTTFLLTKLFCLKLDDNDEAYEFINSLFTPNFNMYCSLSKFQFYVDINEIAYSVTLDYNFEREVKVLISKFLDDAAICEKYLKDFKVILANIFEGGK